MPAPDPVPDQAALPEVTAEARRAPILFTSMMIVGVLLLPFAVASFGRIFDDGDVSWHIATGRWILAHHAVPTTDPFSFTWAGKPWVPMEWLADVIYAAAYDLGGYSGLAVVVAAAMMALNAIVFLNARRWQRFPLITVAAMNLVVFQLVLARPHLLVWPLMALWVWLLMRAREQGRAPRLWTALIMTLWANMHASFLVGLILAGMFGLEGLVASTDRAGALRQWLLFGVVCIVAVCINANGFHGVLYPLNFAHLKMLPHIDEWRPSNIHRTPFFFLVLVVVMALIAWKPPALHPVRWLILAGLLVAALFQQRHQANLAIVAAMLLPRGFAENVERPADAGSRAIFVLLGLGAILFLALRAALPISPPADEANPWTLIAAIPPELRSEPVMNNYSMGGPLILSGIRPYVDGRADMYGDELVLGYGRIFSGNAEEFQAAVKRWNIRWAIAPYRSKQFIEMMERMPGWTRIQQDEVGVIYVRN